MMTSESIGMGEEPRSAWPWIGAAAIVLASFGLAYLWPAHFWGVNFHTYLPIYIVAALLVIAWGRAVAMPSMQMRWLEKLAAPAWVWSLVVAGVSWAWFYFYYLDTKMYGDSLLNLKDLAPGGLLYDQYGWDTALSLHIFKSKTGEPFTFGLVHGLQNMFGISAWAAFRGVSTTFGAAFVFLWMQFLQRRVQSFPARIVVALLGLTAGVTQVFYAEPEVYAAPIFCFTAYLIALTNVLEARRSRGLIGLGILLFCCVRCHASAWTFVPTYLYAALVAYAVQRPRLQAWLGWRRAGWMIPATVMVIAAIGYFTAFKAGDDSVRLVRGAGNMFLTLWGDATPDNAYYIFSGWHFWDYLQLILLSTAMGFALLLGSLFSKQRGALWGNAPMVGLGIGLLCLGSLFVAVDPQLTMARDWDLFSLVSPPILVMAALLVVRMEALLQGSVFLRGMLFSMAMLQFTATIVNHHPMQVHARQLDLARHLFVEGEQGGCYMISHSIEAMPITPEARLSLLQQQIAAVLPYDSPIFNADIALLHQFAGTLAIEAHNDRLALTYYQELDRRLPGKPATLEDLAVLAYNLGQYQPAAFYASQAINAGSTKPANCLLGITCAQLLGNAPLELQFREAYQQRMNDPH